MRYVFSVLTLMMASNSWSSSNLSIDHNSVKTAMKGNIGECDNLQPLEGEGNSPRLELSLKQCQSIEARLCWDGDRAMGGRWSRQIFCYKGVTIVGGLIGSYEQGQNRGAGYEIR